MRVKQLRPGNWVSTSYWINPVDDGKTPAIRCEGILLGIQKRPGNDMGPIAYVATAGFGILRMKASWIWAQRERTEDEGREA